MKLTFLGTRGYIEPRSERHAMHSSLAVSYRGKVVMIDCGEDWLGKLDELRPEAVLVTHAHPDHAFGLREGAPCPVYATRESWERMENFPIADRRMVRGREPFELCGITFEAFPVQHSIRAPAVGYRIGAGRKTVFYAPDLVYIHDRAAALADCALYIGDGATVSASMVRRDGDQLFGHTPVRTQLTWCRKEGVPKMIVTHCGSGIVTGEMEGVRDQIRAFARERGVEVEVAYDGMEVVL
jgi:phosphoribosyl 1,2-cyclic phosphodiesterase